MKYPLRFKAAILECSNKPLVLDEVIFEGPLKDGQVLVRIHYSGICGKQIEEIQAAGGVDPYLPHMLGHEGSGEVIDVGPGVKKVKPGDLTVLQWVKGSGMDAVRPLYKRNGKKVNAGWITTFNEYGVISENRMTPIPKGTDFKVAALLGCAATTGVGVILNRVRPHPGESIAIFGCGGVGLSAVQGAALISGCQIIAVDRNPESLEMALKFGATHTINSDKEDAVAGIRKLTNGIGANYVIIAVSNPEIIELAVGTSSLPGEVYFVSVPPAGSKITVDALDIHKRRALLSSWGGDIVPDRDIAAYLDLDRKGSLSLKELITNTVSLDNINDGINMVLSGRAGRCLIRMFDDAS